MARGLSKSREYVLIKREPQEISTLEGKRFIGSDVFTNLGAGDTQYYFIDFSNVIKLIEVHDFNLSADGQCLVHVYSNPVLSDKSNEIKIVNSNSKSKNSNQLVIYSNPTIVSNGVEVFSVYVAEGSRGDRVMHEIFSYRVIGNDMLIGIENVSGTSMAYGSIILGWRET